MSSNIVFHFCCSSFSIVLQLANKLSVPKFAYKFNFLCDICQLFASLRHPVSGAECRSVVTESVCQCINDEPRLKCSRQVLPNSESHFLPSLLQYPEENQDFKIREILKSASLLFSCSLVSKTLCDPTDCDLPGPSGVGCHFIREIRKVLPQDEGPVSA